MKIEIDYWSFPVKEESVVTINDWYKSASSSLGTAFRRAKVAQILGEIFEHSMILGDLE